MVSSLQRLDERIQSLEPRTETSVLVKLLQECGKLKAFSQGCAVHCYLSQFGRDRNTFVGNHLVHMYGKCGKLKQATEALEGIDRPNIFSWNILISAFAQNGNIAKARKLFDETKHKDAYTWTIMVAAYAQKGEALEAVRLFTKMPERDIVAWNALVAAYAHAGHPEKTVELLNRISVEGVECNRVTYANAFSAFANPCDLKEAVRLHSRMETEELGLDLDFAVGNALIGMYARCGSAERAKRCFDEMPKRDVVSWTGLMSAYSGSGYPQKALLTFIFMDLEGIPANFVTFTSVIDSCSRTGCLHLGRFLHGHAVESGVADTVEVATALVNMYARCGSLECATQVFNDMPCRNVVSWSSIVAAYARGGFCSRAMELFSAMNVEGETPTSVTFTVLLTACTHAGLLHEGWRYFESMSRDFGIDVMEKHYACMLDILARSGRVQETEELLGSMPFKLNVGACIGSCKTILEETRNI